jgi:hypothetical protein
MSPQEPTQSYACLRTWGLRAKHWHNDSQVSSVIPNHVAFVEGDRERMQSAAGRVDDIVSAPFPRESTAKKRKGRTRAM